MPKTDYTYTDKYFPYEEDNPYPTVVAAQTADMMLSMENIDASFVVTKREDGIYNLVASLLSFEYPCEIVKFTAIFASLL